MANAIHSTAAVAVTSTTVLAVGPQPRRNVLIVNDSDTDVFISMATKEYLNDMAGKQKKLGWIKKYPDFTKIKLVDDSILRKVAKEVNFTN